ncbi:SGNH/GDSL hydrolase family protein [Glycomyces sp. TRM65418]|uniref:SGNH/GDSL hydrolase family protein n=1 Tax=Glycomyces sp. TRM65418 TaxID=2867006 RepID=UPI001CE5CC36|nr:SGNH/GDSL hydrolase family protein [Glycomyces sp. TRM65418]MCC3765358.1 SGNH/GDSL hydrolase family protein [Glycomyces sp. TRM65418]QZD54975.1 SGNH/GDSL hydrolase family protein [Glycomyces sp. TRM65418]
MSLKEGKTRRVLARVAAVAAAAGLGVTALAGSASADITIQQYVALGDSYASGVGAGDYLADDGCYRSANAYPREAAAALGERLWFEACSGARVEDVIANQLDHLYRVNTEHVTIGVGGNDAGFSSVLGACAGTDTALCEAAIANARDIITTSLPDELDDLYTRVRNRAFSAEIVVVGNPRLFNETSCSGTLAITPAEQALLNDTADLLAETTAAVAADHGFDFADPREAFTGHEVCSADPWILGYVGTLESFHPNAAGQAAYADVVIPHLDY